MKKKMVELCQHCNKRPATAYWVGEGGSLAYVHGFYQRWCEICCLEEQIRYAREKAANIADLERKLAELKDYQEAEKNP